MSNELVRKMSNAIATATKPLKDFTIANGGISEFKNYIDVLYTVFSDVNDQHESFKQIFTKNKNIEHNMTDAIRSKKFTDYIKSIDSKLIRLEKIEIRDIYMFGPNVGFIFMHCTLYERITGSLIPSGAVFVRGGAVGILVIVECEEQKYALLTQQIRVPGGHDFVEVIAGMLDENGDPKGVAVKELYEESGITIKADDLIEVSTMYPSIGGCDEAIICYNTKLLKMDIDRLKKIQSKTFGVEDEKIKILAKPINTPEEVFQLAKYGDSKLNTCLLAYIQSQYTLTEKHLN